MPTSEVPVNRALVGILAIVCAVLAAILAATRPDAATSLWTGAFLRTAVLLGAFWLALPTAKRDAAWARVPVWQVLGWLMAIVVVARTRIPFKILIPGIIIFGSAWILLRPRPKTRPSHRSR